MDHGSALIQPGHPPDFHDVVICGSGHTSPFRGCCRYTPSAIWLLYQFLPSLHGRYRSHKMPAVRHGSISSWRKDPTGNLRLHTPYTPPEATVQRCLACPDLHREPCGLRKGVFLKKRPDGYRERTADWTPPHSWAPGNPEDIVFASHKDGVKLFKTKSRFHV